MLLQRCTRFPTVASVLFLTFVWSLSCSTIKNEKLTVEIIRLESYKAPLRDTNSSAASSTLQAEMYSSQSEEQFFFKIRERGQTFRRWIGQVTSNTNASKVSGIWRGRERINRVSGGLAPEFQTFPVSRWRWRRRWRRQRGNSAGRGVRVAGARDGTKVSVCIKPREPGGYRLSVRRLPPRRLLCGLRTARGYVPCLTSSATQIQLKLWLSASASPAFPRFTLSLSLSLFLSLRAGQPTPRYRRPRTAMALRFLTSARTAVPRDRRLYLCRMCPTSLSLSLSLSLSFSLN